MSSKKTKRKNKKINGKKLIIALIGILFIIYLISAVFKLLKNPSSTFIVSNGKLSKEESLVAYISREETVIDIDEEKGEIVRIKKEGEKVAKGDPIFNYSSEEVNNLKNKIKELDKKIQDNIENEDGIFSSDKKMLESQVISKMNEAYKENNLQNIANHKENIDAYINKIAKIVGEKSPSGSYLKELINERSRYENQMNSINNYITAPESGIVTYKIDGNEEKLAPTDLSNLNKEFLDKLNIRTGEAIASTNNKVKVVNNIYCYLIVNSDSEESKKVEINKTINVEVQGNKSKATVANIIEEENGSRTIALRLQNNVENLIPYRKVSVNIIWWEASGFRVPNTSVKELNGISYVVRNRNGYLNKMAVKVLKQTDEYSIIEGIPNSELKEAGVSSDIISNLRVLTLYDEILLNPTEEQLLQ